MFPSGRWHGFWELEGWGRRFMDDLELHFQSGRVEGRGHDCIGRFTFGGTYTDDGAVRLVKLYAAHSVLYQGQVTGEGPVTGWWFSGWTGPFALWPASGSASDAPIEEFDPGTG
jgi:hypothetical protein